MLVQEKVFGFDVTMKDVISVEILDCQASLVEETEDLFRCKSLSFMDVGVKISAFGILQYQIDVVVLLDVVMELNDIGVL